MFKDLPDRTTPLNASYLNHMLDLILPINKVEVFFDAEDHSDYMGFTWERISQGRVPVGLDKDDTDFDTIGKTGGSKYLQSHRHQLNGGSGNKYYASGTSSSWLPFYEENVYKWSTDNIIKDSDGNNITTGNSGNLQPYIVMAFWKRVA